MYFLLLEYDYCQNVFKDFEYGQNWEDYVVDYVLYVECVLQCGVVFCVVLEEDCVFVGEVQCEVDFIFYYDDGF